MESDRREQIRVVVVEDEAITAMDLGAQLEALGYAVVASVFSAADAIRAVEGQRPDVVLMDIRLQGDMDGIAAAQAIRARMDVPVIYATAYADEATLQRAKVTEPFGYILKPFDDRALHTAIEVAVTRHRMERQRADWLAMVSHDIRTPLGVMLAYTEMLGEEVRGGNRVAAEDLVERLTSTMLSLHLLVTNYLEVSRIESGRLRVRRETLQVNDLVLRVRGQFEAEARRRQVRFDLALQDPLPPIEVDAVAAERIVTNLVSNALKFTRPDGRITITSAAREREIVVAVADNGSGIPAAQLPHLFDRYGSAAAPELGGGMGLGLFTVKTLVDALGGRIEVASTPDSGTCFRVFLPVAPGAAAPALPA
jgi:signal transduction histidine kinase